MTDGPFLSAYRGTLPVCGCYEIESGQEELGDTARSQLRGAVQLGAVIADTLASAQVCPVAMPHLLALVVSSAATRLSIMHQASLPEEEWVDSPMVLVPELRRLLDTVAALLPAHVARSERIALEMMKADGVAGTC